MPPEGYREAMRRFIITVSEAAKAEQPGFLIVPQNGQELLTDTGAGDGEPQLAYMAAIDGQGREDLFYGYDKDDMATLAVDTEWMSSTLDLAENHGIEVLVTDYCWTPSKMDDSYAMNAGHDFISFAADRRDLDNIPVHPSQPYNGDNGDNVASIETLEKARNFLYLLDPGGFENKTAYLEALANTTYDLFIIDAY